MNDTVGEPLGHPDDPAESSSQKELNDFEHPAGIADRRLANSRSWISQKRLS